MKKIISLFLSILMVATMFPISVFAEEVTEPKEIEVVSEEPEEIPQLGINSRKQNANGDKQQNIAAQIDNAVNQHRIIGTVINHIPVVADRQKGLQVDIHSQLLLII